MPLGILDWDFLGLAVAGLGPLEAGEAWRLALGAERTLSSVPPSTMARSRVAAARMVFA
jgi:hypothetical protein